MDRRLVAIFFLLFSLYFLNTRFSLDGYELEYVLSAMNVFHGNGPALAPGFTNCPGIAATDGDQLVYPRQNLIQTYLSVPFYAVGAFIFGEAPTIPGRGGYWNLPWGPVMTVSMLNPLLAALLAILVALLARDLGIQPPGNYVVAVLYGITSMNWHYAALGMEVVQTSVMMSAIWAAVRFRRTGKIPWLILASTLVFVLPNCKKISFIFILPIIGYLIWSIFQLHVKIARHALSIIGIGMIAGCVAMTWSMFSRFHSDPNLFPHFLRMYLDTGQNKLDLIFGLILSPGEGLLVFNPLIWFALPAWPDFYRKFRSEAVMFMGLAVILIIMLLVIPYVLIDEEWGPRYLFPLLPLFYIIGSRGFLKKRTGSMKKVFIFILILSIAIQWLSSMYLGFKMLDIPLSMGVSDYLITAFIPSMSQIWLAATCFVSHLHHLARGESLIFEHREYSTYIGLGGFYKVLRQDLDSFDYPSGGLFTVRWVLSEKGVHGLSPWMALILKLSLDASIMLVLGLIIVFPIRRKSMIISESGLV